MLDKFCPRPNTSQVFRRRRPSRHRPLRTRRRRPPSPPSPSFTLAGSHIRLHRCRHSATVALACSLARSCPPSQAYPHHTLNHRRCGLPGQKITFWKLDPQWTYRPSCPQLKRWAARGSAMASHTPVPRVSEQKKRALEALDRRLAVETERREEQQRRQDQDGALKKSKLNPKEGVRAKREEPSGDDLVGISSSRVTAPSVPSKKGGDVHPVYSEISETAIHGNLLKFDGLEMVSRQDAIKNIVNEMVQKGDEGIKFARGRSLKIDNWILLDNFVPKDNTLKDARLNALRNNSKRSKIHMSKRQHKKCGSFELPKDFCKFELFEPMHQMWKEYIMELLNDHGKKKLVDCLLLADLHGAFVLVVECKIMAFKGVSGIMIRETAETFGLITQDNHFRVVPKVGSIFIFQAGSWKVTLCGDKVSERMLNQNIQQKNQNLLTR